jgi:hypothetical protein
MGPRGAEFSELAPKNPDTGRLRNEFFGLIGGSQGLEHGTVSQVTPLDSFRLGQQIFFWLGVGNPLGGATGIGTNWISRLRLKLWWARPNPEYRTPGNPQYLGIDQQTFLGTTEVNNRYVWIPSPKRLDITQYQTPSPPPAAEPRTSDSLLLDDVLTLDLQDPNDAAYQASFPDPQIVSRWSAFFYPAMGYALGFTWDAEFAEPVVGQPPLPLISLTYAVGTLGGTNYQESIG